MLDAECKVPLKPQRHSTGIRGLDQLLGGGLLPGTLTVVRGATGIGKTQLGLQMAAAGLSQEGQRGVVFDMSARGDSQNHQAYAERLAGWKLAPFDADRDLALDDRFFTGEQRPGDYLHVFDYSGRRVTRQDLDFYDWHAWQVEFNAKLRAAIGFLYGHFVHGVQRVIVDGIEPAARPHDSIQFQLFEYIYHQVLRKDPLWVARDLFRELYRSLAANAERHQYAPEAISCVLLCTSQEMLLEEMIARPLDEGDALSNANTLILMGKIRDGQRMGRALYIAKHRGSACADEIVPFEIGDDGVSL